MFRWQGFADAGGQAACLWPKHQMVVVAKTSLAVSPGAFSAEREQALGLRAVEKVLPVAIALYVLPFRVVQAGAGQAFVVQFKSQRFN